MTVTMFYVLCKFQNMSILFLNIYVCSNEIKMNQREDDKHKNEDNSYRWEEKRVIRLDREQRGFQF